MDMRVQNLLHNGKTVIEFGLVMGLVSTMVVVSVGVIANAVHTYFAAIATALG